MAKEEIINKLRFLRVGYLAPKSRYHGIITNETLFGTGKLSTFNYNTRYCKEEEDKDYQYDSLFNYEARYSDKKNFTITKHGPLDTKEKIEQFRQMGIETLKDKGNVMYESIISLANTEIAKKYNMLGSKGFGEVVDKVMDNWLKKCGFEPDNVEWFLDYHPDNRTSKEPHPHMHMCFFEKTQTRDRCKIPVSKLNDFKQMFATKMAKRCMSNSKEMNKLLTGSDKDREAIKTSLKNCNIAKIKNVRDLWKVLPSSGRLQYNSVNMINFRPAIDKVVDNLLKTPEFKEKYNSYVDKLKEYDTMVNKISGNSGQQLDSFKQVTEDKKLRTEIAQFILSKKKEYDYEINYDNFTKNKHGKKLSAISISKKLNSRKNYRTNSERYVHKFVNGALASRQREIEDEIEKFLKATQNEYENS